ncbi:putative membrane-associated, metal-dependent hydrolase [Crenothrix polyspora]|uniref:Putative membrane-associated, metal-dependent hydrolase n=1 Tax=Crenothrix polyspora TaxID=360316 RepID=A0A1R4H611_9GAMM|nr:phosphoethanolamine--lipid A transferase [Crenothrix polyspora]SJM91300.1 putative membrane-associated, metal-dependent hydrolase [Crenothrix polyspora]
MLSKKWPKPTLTLTQLLLATALFLALFDNQSFFQAAFKVADQSSFTGIGFKCAIVISLIALFTALLSVFANKYLFKPFVIVILITASVISFFMDSYGVIVDTSMIQNMFETDSKEILELISIKLVLHILFWGLLPAMLIYHTDIQYQPFLKELSTRVIVFVLAIGVLAGAIFSNYKELSFVDRNNKHLRYLIDPNHAVYALIKYLKRSAHPKVINVAALGLDARQTTTWQTRGKKSLLILVVGETARAQNFSLNGYSQLTNPELGKEDIINFPDTHSCGTATAASVPCMFSQFSRDDYDEAKAEKWENLLDVLKHAGISVFWRDNNSGCKGVCNRTPTEAMENLKIPDLCNSEECYDEVLLHGLQAMVDKLPNDSVIVMHQKGSHGPAYYKRYPSKFKVFTPECDTNQVQDCPQDQIVHAYDNTILYTDHFLTQVIHFLQQNSTNYHTAMLYMSDHGESLGENGIYLHGLPYMLAPDEQKHIPFILWLSKGFAEKFGIDKACLKQNSAAHYSHDNLFHSVLGLMSVQTSVYNKGYDIFHGCRE